MLKHLALLTALIFILSCASAPRAPARATGQETEPQPQQALRPAFATPDPENLVILVFGDSGTGSSVQYEVGASMYSVCQVEKCQFALGLGDNIYENGASSATDPKFGTHFEKAYEAFGRFDFWMVPGNHDHRTKGAKPEVEYTQFSPRWRMPALHYAVTGLPEWVSIYGLDTEELDEKQLETAEAALCGKPGWKILYGHHPLYSNGSHGDDRGRQKKVDPLLKKCGIQAFLAGHDHHQEHISGPGTEYFIQGAAAKTRGVKRDVKYPPGSGFTQHFATSEYGFGVMKLTREAMSMRFYDRKGNEMYRWPTH